MTTLPPKIDLRTYADLVADTESLAQYFTEYVLLLKSPFWEPSTLESFTIDLTVPRPDAPSSKSSVFLDKIEGFYHLRIFDADVKKIIDAGRGIFSPDDSLRKLLDKCFGLQVTNPSIDETVKRNLLRQLAFPKEGKGLVVVGKYVGEDVEKHKDVYHVRIFDWTGKQIVDKDKFKPAETLRQQLEDAFNCQSNNQLIDYHSKSKLLGQIQASLDLTHAFQWIPSMEGKTDVGSALIRIFGRMVSLVSDRLNRSPEKHFLTFLDLIGTQIQPPQPARVPLTFSLVERNEGSPNLETFVPAGTQVAAAASEGQEEVVFETEQDLVVISTQLQAVYVRQPATDQYSDHTDIALGKKPESFLAFEGDTGIEHSLYLALDDKLVALPGDKTLTLIFKTPDVANLSNLLGEWEYWDGILWKELPNISNSTPTPNSTSTSGSSPSQEQVKIEKKLPDDFQQCTVDKKTAAWLRVKLKLNQPNPSITSIQAKVKASNLNLLPDRCLLNTTALDLSKDFFPFGEQPQFNDTLYLTHARVFAIPGVTVTLTIDLTRPANQYIPLLWEVGNGKVWESITPTGDVDAIRWKNNAKGAIVITIPSTLIATVVNDESNFWIRVRVNQLNYGKVQPSEPIVRAFTSKPLPETPTGAKDVLNVGDVQGFLVGDKIQILDSNNNATEVGEITNIDRANKTLTLKSPLTNIEPYPIATGIVLQDDSTATIPQAPVVKTLKITGYSIENQSLAACLTINDFQIVDCTKEANSKDSQNFQPFRATTDQKPALYLGFDQPFPNRSISLHAQIAAATAAEIAAAQPPAAPPRLVWEYSTTGNRWKTLNVQDGTDSFSKRGLIRFIGPLDFKPKQEFGQSLYWLRVRWNNWDQTGTSSFRIPPKLERWLTNTTWATQSTTLRDEILGGSDGTPNQRFYATQVPILLGHRLQVQESAFLPPGEVSALQQKSSGDATVLYDDIGQIEAIWVRWQEVRDFYDSTPHDRHYRLDRLTGEIRFGDGQNGRIPPQGRQNIRLALYRTGGGERGNLPARTINQLKTTIPYIDQVSNLEPSAGGAEQESLEQVQDRGPKSLRHRDKAITVQDFEDLTFAASTDIARVLVIVPTFLSSTTSTQTTSARSLGPLDPRLWFDPNKPVLDDDLDRHKEAKKEAELQNVGQVQVMIVPRSPLAQPIPSLALIEEVEAYLRSRCAPTVRVQVGVPPWVRVSVTATVVPQSLEVADGLAQLVHQRLDQFLHPLTGGVAGQGWPFGREPHISDLYGVIEAIAQVNYVQSLILELSPASLPDHFLVYSGIHSITLA